jgi:hypothetical protein
MKKIIFIAFILITSIITSCDDDTYCTIKGRLMCCCDSTPYANQDIYLSQKPNLFNNHTASASTKTDSNGYFIIRYNHNSGNDMNLDPILEDVPSGANINLGDLIIISKNIIIFKIKVNNPYTVNDTLTGYVFGEPSSTFYLSGPFHDTILPQIDIYSQIKSFYTYKSNPEIRGGWQISSNSTIISPAKEVTIQVPKCHSIPDTLTMVIN